VPRPVSANPPAALLAALRGEARSARALARTGAVGVHRGAPGPGPASAAAARVPPEARLLISWGCAGGLQGDLRPGELLLPSAIVDRHGGTLAVDAGLRAGLSGALATLRPRHGTLAETARVVTCSGARRALARRTGAVAVDMESAAIARAAAASGRRFVAIRVVADSATLELDRLPALDTGAARILLASLRRPQVLPTLCRLGLAYRRALRTLARAAALLAAQPGLLAAEEVSARGEPAARVP